MLGSLGRQLPCGIGSVGQASDAGSWMLGERLLLLSGDGGTNLSCKEGRLSVRMQSAYVGGSRGCNCMEGGALVLVLPTEAVQEPLQHMNGYSTYVFHGPLTWTVHQFNRHSCIPGLHRP